MGPWALLAVLHWEIAAGSPYSKLLPLIHCVLLLLPPLPPGPRLGVPRVPETTLPAGRFHSSDAVGPELRDERPAVRLQPPAAEDSMPAQDPAPPDLA